MNRADPHKQILTVRLKRWRERLASAEGRGDDSAYIANCRTEIERLEDALRTKQDMKP